MVLVLELIVKLKKKKKNRAFFFLARYKRKNVFPSSLARPCAQRHAGRLPRDCRGPFASRCRSNTARGGSVQKVYWVFPFLSFFFSIFEFSPYSFFFFFFFFFFLCTRNPYAARLQRILEGMATKTTNWLDKWWENWAYLEVFYYKFNFHLLIFFFFFF
jgi:hypothetical protein